MKTIEIQIKGYGIVNALAMAACALGRIKEVGLGKYWDCYVSKCYPNGDIPSFLQHGRSEYIDYTDDDGNCVHALFTYIYAP